MLRIAPKTSRGSRATLAAQTDPRSLFYPPASPLHGKAGIPQATSSRALSCLSLPPPPGTCANTLQSGSAVRFIILIGAGPLQVYNPHVYTNGAFNKTPKT